MSEIEKMKQYITLTGGAAAIAMRMIAKARAQYPILDGATDEEVLTLLVGASLAKEVRR